MLAVLILILTVASIPIEWNEKRKNAGIFFVCIWSLVVTIHRRVASKSPTRDTALFAFFLLFLLLWSNTTDHPECIHKSKVHLHQAKCIYKTRQAHIHDSHALHLPFSIAKGMRRHIFLNITISSLNTPFLLRLIISN